MNLGTGPVPYRLLALLRDGGAVVPRRAGRPAGGAAAAAARRDRRAGRAGLHPGGRAGRLPRRSPLHTGGARPRTSGSPPSTWAPPRSTWRSPTAGWSRSPRTASRPTSAPGPKAILHAGQRDPRQVQGGGRVRAAARDRHRRARAGQLPRRRAGVAADHARLGPVPGARGARPRARLPGRGRQRREHHGHRRALRRRGALGRQPAVRQDRHRHRLRHLPRRRGLPGHRRLRRRHRAHPGRRRTGRCARAATSAASRRSSAAPRWPGTRTAAARAGTSPALAERLAAQRRRSTRRGRRRRRGRGRLTCIRLIRDGGRRVGRVLAGLVSFINPSMIVIGGGLAGLGHMLLAEIRSVVYRRSLPLATGNLPVVLSELGPRAGVVGAAVLASDYAFGRSASRRLSRVAGRRSPLLRLTGVVKTFPGVRALDGVDLEVAPGEVHCLLGQNGAGKSTLIKVLAGVHRPDAGEIAWRGEPVSFATPQAAMRAGIATIYQELDLVDGLTRGGEHLPRPRAAAGRLRPPRPDARRRPGAILARLGHAGDPGRPRGRPAARRGQADRQHGPGAVPRGAAAHHGRAERGARPRRGGQPVPGDPGADRRRASRSSTSRTGWRRSARSATGSPCSRTGGPPRSTCPPGPPRPASWCAG